MKSILRINTHQQVTQHKRNTIALSRNCALLSSPTKSEFTELEGLLTYDECKQVLETFQNDKSPGEDGFTVEFYKFFFELLGHNLVECFNGAYEANELSISQRRGIITLIPKEDGSLLDLSNWRPITLLNVDYKIAKP